MGNAYSPTTNAQPGQTIQLIGTLVNTTASILDLNGIAVNLSGPYTIDVNPFFTGPITIAANGTHTWFAFADITVQDPFAASFGLFPGLLTIQGAVEGLNGYDPMTQDFLGEVAFNLNVQKLSDVPEPATLGFCAVGIAALLVARRYRLVDGQLKRSR